MIWAVNELDEFILGEIKKLAINPDYVKQAQEQRIEKSDASDKIKLLKNEVKKINEQISRFMDLYGLGTFTVEQLTDKTDPLNAQRDALNNEIEKLSRPSGQLSEEEAYQILETVDEVIENAEFEDIRQIVESLISKIELDGEDIYIHWKFA